MHMESYGCEYDKYINTDYSFYTYSCNLPKFTEEPSERWPKNKVQLSTSAGDLSQAGTAEKSNGIEMYRVELLFSRTVQSQLNNR